MTRIWHTKDVPLVDMFELSRPTAQHEAPTDYGSSNKAVSTWDVCFIYSPISASLLNAAREISQFISADEGDCSCRGGVVSSTKFEEL